MFRGAQWEEGDKKAVAQRLLVRTLLVQHPPTWSQRQCKRMNFVFHSGTTPARHQHSRTPKLCWSMSCSPAYLSSPCSSTCWSSSPSLTLGRYLACSSSSLLMFLVTFLESYFWLDTQQPHDLTVSNMSFFPSFPFKATPQSDQPAPSLPGCGRPHCGPPADASGDHLRWSLLVPGWHPVHALLCCGLHHNVSLGGQHGAHIRRPLCGRLLPLLLLHQGHEQKGQEQCASVLALLHPLQDVTVKGPPGEAGPLQLLPGRVCGRDQQPGRGRRPHLHFYHTHHSHHSPVHASVCRGGSYSSRHQVSDRRRDRPAFGGSEEDGDEGCQDSGCCCCRLPVLLLSVLFPHAGRGRHFGQCFVRGRWDLADPFQLLLEPCHLRLFLSLVQEMHSTHLHTGDFQAWIMQRQSNTVTRIVISFRFWENLLERYFF